MRSQDIETARAIGRNLRRCRILAGLSQAQLGAHMGVSFQQVQKYERGTNQLSAIALQRLASLFACETSSFFDAEGATTSLPLALPDQRIIVRITRALRATSNHEVREALLTLMETLGRSGHEASH